MSEISKVFGHLNMLRALQTTRKCSPRNRHNAKLLHNIYQSNYYTSRVSIPLADNLSTKTRVNIRIIYYIPPLTLKE